MFIILLDYRTSTIMASPGRPRRIRYDSPTASPQQSPHWESLSHSPDDRLLENLEQTKQAFQEHVRNADKILVPLWSAVCGYCEALTTHKDELKRYALYPIPIDALRRLVENEFLPFCKQLKEESQQKETPLPQNKHRETVRHVANAVWKKAQGKSKNVRDELHANSLYVCFRGSIDKRSLDCFGAATVTIAALQYVLEGSDSQSFLTLSEDHAYESNVIASSDHDDKEGALGTCEIAIPGNTKEVQQTRGLDVAEALEKANKNKKLSYAVTPDSCWLYMKSHAVVCKTIPMTVGAVLGNINCSIQAKGSTSNNLNSSNYFVSGPLMDLKRELLWVLKDDNHLTQFPFALMELGECEEHRTTARGLEWVDAIDQGIQDKVMAVEKLYLDAMFISRNQYGDAQAYPYFCAGHYHKDAVWEEIQDGENRNSLCQFNAGREYRLVESVRLYSEASRVASRYCYDMQLMKHMTKASKLIMDDILTQEGMPRTWCQKSNAIATGTWLMAFCDSLLAWEEEWGGKQFCEILTPNHPNSIGKMFQLLSAEVRKEAIDRVFADNTQDADGNAPAITENNLLYFSKPRSKRMQRDSPLVAALGKEKVVIREMELTIPMSDSGGRRSKRPRRG
jgi:Menin